MFPVKNAVVRMVSILCAVILLISATPVFAAETANGNHEYSVNFSVLKDNTEEVSAMDEYTEKPAKVTVEQGQGYVYLTLKKASWISSFQVDSNGVYGNPEDVSVDTEADKKVVRFPVTDVTAKVNAHIVVDVPAINYHGDYKVQIKFDTTGMPGHSNETTNPTEPAPTTPTQPAPSTDPVQAGTQEISFSVLKDGTEEVSSMDSYAVKPAQLSVSDATYKIAFTLKSSNLVTGVTYEQDGAFVNATVLSSNEADNTRVIEFAVKDISQKLNVQLEVQAGPRLMKHTVQFLFEAPLAPGEFRDVRGHWAKESIEQAVKLGIVSGYGNGNFLPNGDVSRAEFAIMIVQALKLNGQSAALPFSDAALIPDWAKSAIAQASLAGIINGYDDGTFRADDKITRSEMAVIIARAAKLTLDPSAKLSFADSDQIPSWAQSSVAAAVNAKLISGRDGNLFAPSANATRAESVSLILTAINSIK
ncbi:MAG: NEAr transporter [Paenibacillus sp.]|nr:NEAr transporter [Paenibacillus sp.]